MAISQLILEKNILKVLTIYGHGGYIGHGLLWKGLKSSNYGKSWVKSQTMTLTFSTHKSSCSHLDNLIAILWPKSSKLSMKSYVLAFSHIRPCHKKKVKVNPRSSFEQSW